MQIQNMILELYRELCKYKIKKTSENFLRFHNFQFDVDAPITSYLFFNGVMCHVSTLIFNCQLSIFNLFLISSTASNFSQAKNSTFL